MPILQEPQRGQPIDYEYLALMARAINNTSDRINSNVTGNVIWTPSGNQSNLKTTDTQISAIKSSFSGKLTKPNDYLKHTVPFGTTFAYIPVVTATLDINKNNDINNDLNVVVASVTTSGVELRLWGAKKGNIKVEINVIAVGIRNS
jgi:hypothetical protein